MHAHEWCFIVVMDNLNAVTSTALPAFSQLSEASMEGVLELVRTFGNRSKPKPSSPLPEELCRQFSLAEMKIATNNFDADLVAGEGGFGRVYKGFIDDCNRTIAIKRLKLKRGQDLGKNLRTEMVLLCQLHHPNLIRLIGYCIDEGVNIVHEFMANGDLSRKLHCNDHDRLSWKQRLKICIGVARARHYLHTGVKQTIIHGNMKPANILLDKNWEAKLSDFTISNILPPGFKFMETEFMETEFMEAEFMETRGGTSSTVCCGTCGYLDPQFFFKGKLSDKIDVYSFGVVLLEVLSGRKAFEWMEEPHCLPVWVKKCIREGTINKIIDPYLMGKIAPECFKIYIDIAISCVRINREARPTMGEVELILEHSLELQQSADAAMKDIDPTGDVCIYPIDEYTCNDSSGDASPPIFETYSSSMPELEEFIRD